MNKISPVQWFKVILVFSSLATSSAYAEQILQAIDPWIRLSPPSLKVNAGYLTLVNRSEQKQSIVAVESSLFGRSHIHSTKLDQGMASMQAVESLDIPPGGQITLKPGGTHLMLMGRKQPVQAGDQVRIEFSMENGDRQSFEFTVKR